MSSKRKTVIGFRPPPEIEDALQQAELATGATATDLVIRCVRHALNAVVKEIELERSKAAAALLDITLKDEFRHGPSESPKAARKAKHV